MKITSRDNPKLKFARRVRDGKEINLVFVEGLRLAEEAQRSDLEITEVFFTENFSRTERGEKVLQTIENNKCFEVSETVFDSITDTKNSQGIVVLGEKPLSGADFFQTKFTTKGKLPLVVLLHQINNPSNLGAILRICEAVNAAGVIITKNSADAFSAKALRGAMGASLRVALWTNADFNEALSWARTNDLTATSADVNAQESYLETDWKKPRLLIFGSEAHGLSVEERNQIAETLLIPMDNAVESLNLAVSCGVILFEAKRQFTNFQ